MLKKSGKSWDHTISGRFLFHWTKSQIRGTWNFQIAKIFYLLLCRKAYEYFAFFQEKMSTCNVDYRRSSRFRLRFCRGRAPLRFYRGGLVSEVVVTFAPANLLHFRLLLKYFCCDVPNTCFWNLSLSSFVPLLPSLYLHFFCTFGLSSFVSTIF